MLFPPAPLWSLWSEGGGGVQGGLPPPPHRPTVYGHSNASLGLPPALGQARAKSAKPTAASGGGARRRPCLLATHGITKRYTKTQPPRPRQPCIRREEVGGEGVRRGGGGGGSGWDTPPPRVSGKKMGKIFFFLPKMAMAPKKTKICGTSSPAKKCLQWGLNQLPIDLQCTVLPLTYLTELLDLCIPRFIA